VTKKDVCCNWESVSIKDGEWQLNPDPAKIKGLCAKHYKIKQDYENKPLEPIILKFPEDVDKNKQQAVENTIRLVFNSLLREPGLNSRLHQIIAEYSSR